MVVEQHHITFFPIVGVDETRTDARALQAVHNVAHGRQVVNDLAGVAVDLADRGRVDLQGERAGDRVLPRHGEDLDLVRVDRRELGVGQFEVIGVQAEPIGAGLGRAHPDVGMWCVLDAAGAGEVFVRR